MNKKLLLIALPALMVMSSCTYLQSATVQPNGNFFKEDTVAHEEVFGELQPRQLGVPEDTPEDSPAWTKTPKIGVQFQRYEKVADSGEWYYAVRYVAAIANTDGMTATWTRAVSEKDSNQIKPLSSGGGHVSSAKYDALKLTPEAEATTAASEGYDKYVVYSMYDIPENQGESYIVAYLTLTKDENSVKSKAVATQINGNNYFSFSADRSAGYFAERIRGENRAIVEIDDDPSGTNVAQEEGLAFNAGDEFEYFYYNPETAFQCFGYSTFNRETYYFEKSATSEYFKVRVNGTYSLYLNENKLLYAGCTAADVTLYLNPNTQWVQGNAKFSVYYTDDSSFHALTKVGESDIYSLEHFDFKAHPVIIFVRHNPDVDGYTWDNKWNQTNDIRYDGAQDGKETGNDNPAKSQYTVNLREGEGGWDNLGGSWSVYSAE